MTPLINGIAYSWVNMIVNIFGVPFAGITKLDYKVKQEKVNNYGQGDEPVARGYGKKEYEASMEVYFDELMRLVEAAPGRNILQIPPFDIQVSFGGNGVAIRTNKIRAAEFTEAGLTAAQGDTKILTTLPLIIAGIEF